MIALGIYAAVFVAMWIGGHDEVGDSGPLFWLLVGVFLVGLVALLFVAPQVF